MAIQAQPTEYQKRQYIISNQENYQNSTMKHHVSLEEMKKNKINKFSDNPKVQHCIAKANKSKDIGVCIRGS